MALVIEKANILVQVGEAVHFMNSFMKDFYALSAMCSSVYSSRQSVLSCYPLYPLSLNLIYPLPPPPPPPPSVTPNPYPLQVDEFDKLGHETYTDEEYVRPALKGTKFEYMYQKEPVAVSV